MGHSFGGMIGAGYLSQYSHNIAGAIFISPAFNLKSIVDSETSTYIRQSIQHVRSYLNITSGETFDWLREAEMFYSPGKTLHASDFLYHFNFTAFLAYLYGARDPEEELSTAQNREQIHVLNKFDFSNKSIDQGLLQGRFVNALESNGETLRDLKTDRTYNLSKITSRTLLITGSYDFLVPEYLSKRDFESFGSKNYNHHVSFSRVGHNAYSENKEATMKRVIDFLEGR